jgi:hypothetical protein
VPVEKVNDVVDPLTVATQGESPALPSVVCTQIDVAPPVLMHSAPPPGAGAQSVEKVQAWPGCVDPVLAEAPPSSPENTPLHAALAEAPPKVVQKPGCPEACWIVWMQAAPFAASYWVAPARSVMRAWHDVPVVDSPASAQQGSSAAQYWSANPLTSEVAPVPPALVVPPHAAIASESADDVHAAVSKLLLRFMPPRLATPVPGHPRVICAGLGERGVTGWSHLVKPRVYGCR